MSVGSVSVGTLFIGKGAELQVDNNDAYKTDVSVNTPAPAANVYIENLTLAGEANIGPTWGVLGPGEDGDAPPAEQPGPVLVTRIDNLTMQPGSGLYTHAYRSGFQFNRLELKQLAGVGDIYLNSSLADGLSDQIYVSEQATGQFGLMVDDSGREVVTPRNVALVYINSGDASFNLLNKDGIIEAGVWQYKLDSKSQDGHTEWFLVGGKPGEVSFPASEPILSNSARAVINMATAPRYVLDTEVSTLRQRMGDLRRHDGALGVWARYLSDNSHLSDNKYSNFRANLNGIQIGADHQTALDNGRFLVGAFTSYSKTHIKSYYDGNGDIQSYGGGIYATWSDNSGFYLDTLLKGSHLSNRAGTQMNSGNATRADYSQNALTAVMESGYSIPINAMFRLLPYGKVAWSRIGKASYTLDNGMTSDIHAANSLQGEVGTLIESEFSLAGRSVKPYARAAIAREFIKNNEITINSILFDSNYSGNVAKYGVGITADIADSASVYGEINYQKGNKVETPVNATAGLRISF